jgi:hypothetical protein
MFVVNTKFLKEVKNSHKILFFKDFQGNKIKYYTRIEKWNNGFFDYDANIFHIMYTSENPTLEFNSLELNMSRFNNVMKLLNLGDEIEFILSKTIDDLFEFEILIHKINSLDYEIKLLIDVWKKQK